MVEVNSVDQIPDGNANICSTSKYRERDLLLHNPGNSSITTVFAHGDFICVNQGDGANIKQTVRINQNEAKKLFGDSLLDAKQVVKLYPAPIGYRYGASL